MIKNLINYQLATKGFMPRLDGGMYTYILAANGVFIYSKNDFFEALVPAGYLSYSVRGLENVEPQVNIVKRVRWNMLSNMVARSYQYLPVEHLFHIKFSSLSKEWFMEEPDQEATRNSVKALNSNLPYSPIEVHSHNTMNAFFSLQDDKEETGLRIYVVLGKVDRFLAEICVRVGIYGHTMIIPYTNVFESFGFIKDVYEFIS